MSARDAVRQYLSRVPATAEAGFSLIEVIVAMGIMSIVMAAFTTGIVQMYRTANKTDAMSLVQSQLNIAFERLDKEIRYAQDISDLDPVNYPNYVEYLMTTAGTATCTELRISNEQLQRRTWPQGQTPLTPAAWIPLASNITSGSFSKPAGTTTNFKRLEVTLTVGTGSGASAATINTDITFTALNSEPSDPPDTVCTEGRSVP